MTTPENAAPRCRADQDTIRAWLASTPEGARQPIQRRLRLDTTFRAGQPHIATRITRLAALAQAADVFGLAGHDIQVWHVIDGLALDSYLLTIQPPTGPPLAVTGLTDLHLLGFGHVGAEAAIATLHVIAREVDGALSAYAARPQPAPTPVLPARPPHLPAPANPPPDRRTPHR